MKNLITLFFLLAFSYGKAQEQEKLYLIKENDSTLSVKNEEGKIIISPFSIIWGMTKEKEEITKDVILVQKNAIDFEVYDRKGNFLFKPAIFDYSAEFSEGYIAFEENGKEGLANKEGKITIPAEYDYIGFLTHGVVEACKGCYYDRVEDEEHPPLVGGTWFWLDKNGDVLDTQSFSSKKTKNFYPSYSFKYNDEEQNILNEINAYKNDIAKKLGLDHKKVCFEIVYSPTIFEPYYHIKIFEKYDEGYISSVDSNNFGKFFYDSKTKMFYGFYNKSKIYKKNGEEIFESQDIKQPLNKWLKNKKVTLY